MESLIGMLILAIITSGVVTGFVYSHRTAEWTAYSLSAQALALQSIEQSRAARWEPYSSSPTDELTNMPAVRVHTLDVPMIGTNVAYATNRVQIRTISTAPPLKEIYSECVWSFKNKRLYTNWVLTLRAPGQSGYDDE